MEDLDLVDCDELQKCPSLAHATYLDVHGGDPWHSKGYEQKYWAYSVCEYGLCILERV